MISRDRRVHNQSKHQKYTETQKKKTITVLMYNNPNDFKSVASKTKLIKKNEEIKTIIHFWDFNPLSEIRPVIYKFAHKRNISYIYILIIISHEQYRLYI
jgi:hypothetical protein